MSQLLFSRRSGIAEMRTILIAVVVAVVIVVVVAVSAALLLYRHGLTASPMGLTPSEVSSVLGGKWSVVDNETYSFTVSSNGYVTLKYLNGTTMTVPFNSYVIFYMPAILLYPTAEEPLQGGYVELLIGTVNGTSEGVLAAELTYPGSSYAQGALSQFGSELQLGGYNVVEETSSELIAYGENPFFTGPASFIAEVRGNNLYIVIVIGPKAKTSQLRALMNYLLG